MLCLEAVGTSVIIATQTVGQICSPTSYVAITPAEYASLQTLMASANGLDLQLIGVTPQNISIAFAFGFCAVFAFWGLGFVLSVAIQLIKRI